MEKDVVVQEFNPVSLMPQTFDGKFQMAQVLAQSGLLPTGLNTPQKVCVALEWGHELQLSPMVAVNNIAVINGKPTLSADIMAAVVKRSPEYGGIKWLQQNEKVAECEITRILSNGEKEVITSKFTIEDAEKAGLLGRDNWRKYPRRMLKHRCQSYGLRDMFPDILAGLYTPEEMESVEVPQERNVTPVTDNITPMTIEAIEQTPALDLAGLTDKAKLIKILETYENEMNVKNKSGNPYEIACKALEEDEPEQISKMLKRTVDYLKTKNIVLEVANG